MESCPLCHLALAGYRRNAEQDRDEIDCLNCGTYSITGSALATIEGSIGEPRARATLSYAIRRMQRPGERPSLDSSNLKAILEEVELPNASERLENLIIYLGSELAEPGATITHLHAPNIIAALGCISGEAAAWVLEQAHAEGLVQGTPRDLINASFALLEATLSLRGWETHRQIVAGGSRSRTAFMAMKYGEPQLDAVFRDYFKPAVKRADFDLKRLDDEPRAGLIDDRLRLEILRSRFLVADLTHGNAGAYWEAGYAEGLGRPVIYTCRKDVFEDRDRRPHFDTNHHETVVWDPNNLPAAAEKLVTTIRVSLPAEARLTD